MENNIVEGNKLIAEFMGYKIWYKDGNKIHVEISPERVQPISEWSKYHSSWDCLMDVCKKFDTFFEGENYKRIARAKKRARIYEDYCDRIDNTVTLYEIIPVFEILVEAIKWHNKNKTHE